MKQRRTRPRPGRHLPPQGSLSLLSACQTAAAMHRTLTREGYVLKPKMRPYLRADGRVTLRFVWRRRIRDRHSVTVDYTGRFRWELPA